MKVAVLGDVHANASALSAALAVVDSIGHDRLVFLGDLLTYGVDVDETLDLIGRRLDDGRAIVLRGNHDALYFDLLGDGDSLYASALPAWIRESIEWTMERLPIERWRELPFVDESRLGRVLLSHANPFGACQWQYLNDEPEHLRAALELGRRGCVAGVFGHTHRVKWFRLVGETGAFVLTDEGRLNDGAVHVLNAGAIGQPRDKLEQRPCVLWLDVGDDPESGLPRRFERQLFDYDVAEHLRRVRCSGLSPGTVGRITSFFAVPDIGIPA